MDPLTAVRYPSVTMVLSPDVTGVTELPGSRHSGGSEEEARGRRGRQTRSQARPVAAIMMTHSVGAGAAQWSDTAWLTPGAAIICKGSNPDPLIISLQRITLNCLQTQQAYDNSFNLLLIFIFFLFENINESLHGMEIGSKITISSHYTQLETNQYHYSHERPQKTFLIVHIQIVEALFCRSCRGVECRYVSFICPPRIHPTQLLATSTDLCLRGSNFGAADTLPPLVLIKSGRVIGLHNKVCLNLTRMLSLISQGESSRLDKNC